MGSDPFFRVAIALGSNLGNRREHLEFAIATLARELDDFKSSTFIETKPEGVSPGQPAYLNGAAIGTTRRSPRELLHRLLQIEHDQGRERPYPLAPRTLDLDLILYGEEIIDEEGLSLPHPRFRAREFVLAPLASIAPEMKDPITGLTIQELLKELLTRTAARR